MIFWKDEVAQNNGYFLGYFLFKQIYSFFTKISSFKAWFVVGILRFQKWFVVDVLGFQIELFCRYFGLLLTWQLFGQFFWKIWYFFLIFWSPWKELLLELFNVCLSSKCRLEGDTTSRGLPLEVSQILIFLAQKTK